MGVCTININKTVLFSVYCAVFLFSAPVIFAEVKTDTVRVHYRLDGSVSVSSYVREACKDGETETACRDRIDATTPYAGLSYDDVRVEDLPADRTFRDKWRGEKGRGVWVDNTLTTRKDKMEEYQKKIDEELEKDRPDSSDVLKLQHLIEKVGDIDHSILSQDDIDRLEKKRGFFASAVTAVSDVFSSIFNGIKQGVLALASLVTDTLQVGSPAAPAGITVYDVKTKEPYCVVVSNGKIENIPGECGATAANPTSAVTPPIPAEPQNSGAPIEPEGVNISTQEEPILTNTQITPEPVVNENLQPVPEPQAENIEVPTPENAAMPPAGESVEVSQPTPQEAVRAKLDDLLQND